MSVNNRYKYVATIMLPIISIQFKLNRPTIIESTDSLRSKNRYSHDRISRANYPGYHDID